MDGFPRRQFLQTSAALLAGAVAANQLAVAQDNPQPQDETNRFKVSLSQRSLSKRLESEQLAHLDFAEVARGQFGIDAIDYSSRFFQSHAADDDYLSQMNRRAADHGVRQVLLMIDGEGQLAIADAAKRKSAVDRHRRWIDAAATLGCRAVCVRVVGNGKPADQAVRAAQSLQALTEHGTESKITVLVANDQGVATAAEWLLSVVKQVDSTRCAAFPVLSTRGPHAEAQAASDRDQQLAQLMKAAKGVCVTTHEFDTGGNERKIDLLRMMKVVLEAGYRGYVSVEYRGEHLDEYEGIRATKALLDWVSQADAMGAMAPASARQRIRRKRLFGLGLPAKRPILAADFT